MDLEYNLVYFEKGPKMRAKFVGELSECWTVIMEDFWQCEKFIREKIATIARKTKVNVPKWKEILAIVPEEREVNFFLFSKKILLYFGNENFLMYII